MRFFTGVFAGAALSSSIAYAALVEAQRQRLRQSIRIREQALLLDSLHDRAVVIPEEAPISILRTTLRRVDPYEPWKMWWNAKVEDLGLWLTGGGLEGTVMKAEKGVRTKVGEWVSGDKET